MKTLQLTDETLFALKLSVAMNYDMNGDMLFDEIPLSVTEVRSLASKSDDELRDALREVRDDINAKVDLLESLAILKHQLDSL